MKKAALRSAGALLLALGTASAGARSSPAPVYARDIRPILQARCVVCHSAKTLSAPALSGGLALDTFAALKAGIGGGAPRAVLVPGKSAASEIYTRLIASSASKLMPKGGPALPAAQIALVRAWIDSGAAAGDPNADRVRSEASPASLPMPPAPALQETRFPTLLKPPADLLDRFAPRDAALSLGLHVGPLPAVTALAFSPDGKTLAVGGYRAVTLWSLVSGRPSGSITHLPGPVQCLAFRPGGGQLAVAGGTPGVSGEVQVFDAGTLKSAGPALQGHSDVVMSVVWSSDGKWLATGSQDKTARIWLWPEGRELKQFKDHSDAVTGVAFSADGKALYTASMDHNLRRYDTGSGALVRALTGHGEGVTAMAFSAKSNLLLSAGTETELRRWNPDTGENTGRVGGHSAVVTDLVFSQDSKFIVSASGDHSVRLWDGASTGQIRQLNGSEDWVYAAAISPDDRWTAGGGADGIVRLWDTATGRLRLMLLSWPSDHGLLPAWAAVTPEGFFDAAPSWAALLHPDAAEKPAPRLSAFVRSLHQPDTVLKAWQDGVLEPPKFTARPPASSPASSAAK